MDEQAERKRIGQGDDPEVGGGRPGGTEVPALERAPEDRVRMPLTRYRTDVRRPGPQTPPASGNERDQRAERQERAERNRARASG